MAESRYTWEKGVRADYSDRKQQARAQRAERTRDITLAWKEGFLRLKAENDALQKERDVEYANAIAAAEVWLRETLARGYPQG